jgi:hypothetical protein
MTKLIKTSKPSKSKNKKKQAKLLTKTLRKGLFCTITGFNSMIKGGK